MYHKIYRCITAHYFDNLYLDRSLL